MRRLGRRWAKIHQLIYPIAILGVWHYWWQVKQDWREPLVYASIVALLLGARLVRHNLRKVRSAVAGKPTTELAPGQSRNPI
jgi:sulfoxide reductase heme-binding subunit YedZ